MNALLLILVFASPCPDREPQDAALARNVSLAANFDPDITVLASGEAAADLAQPTARAWNYFGIDVPCDGSTVQSIEFEMTGPPGSDADIYVNHGSRADEANWFQPNGRPWEGDSNETVTIENPECGEWHAAIQAWRPYSGVSLTATIKAEPTNSVDCLGQGTEELPDKVKEMWGEEPRREHHQLWHFVSGGGWNRLPPNRQADLRARGWEPPDHNQEQLGLDFICMHRQMVDYTQQAYEAVGTSCKLEGWSLDEFPWGLDNNDNDQKWPAPPWPGNPAFKTERSARDMRQQVTSTFGSDDWLRDASLGQVARGIERSFHNWMHMRFAQTQPTGDACATDWLGSTCSSQQNEYFWMLHPLIDTFPQRWARANAGRTVPLYRGGPQVTIPENFAASHATPATDEEVYEFTTGLVFRQHDCWMGPMPGPPTIAGSQLVSMSMPMPMDPNMAARNVANTSAVVDMLNADGDALRNFTVNTFGTIIPIYQLMSGMLSPEEKAVILGHVDVLSTPVDAVHYTLLTENEAYVLRLIINNPEDFTDPSATMVTTVRNAIRKIRDHAYPSLPPIGPPGPLGQQVHENQRPAADAIVELIRQNPGIMAIPEVADALSGTAIEKR